MNIVSLKVNFLNLDINNFDKTDPLDEGGDELFAFTIK